MPTNDETLASGLYEAAHGLIVALTAARDWSDQEGLSRAEAEVRGAIRRHLWPSPEEQRIFTAEDFKR